jgi:hypothetical protein
MTDDALVAAFESTELPADLFPHAAHVRVAWWYLHRHPILIALARFRTGLQRFAAAKGKPDRYHETITIALMLLIAERLGGARDLSWDAFAARHPELLAWPSPLLREFYADDVVASARAKEMFVLPETAG